LFLLKLIWCARPSVVTFDYLGFERSLTYPILQLWDGTMFEQQPNNFWLLVCYSIVKRVVLKNWTMSPVFCIHLPIDIHIGRHVEV
jgi:hypothetical protein